MSKKRWPGGNRALKCSTWPPTGNPNTTSPKLRVGAVSWVIPVRIYDLDLITGERTLLSYFMKPLSDQLMRAFRGR